MSTDLTISRPDLLSIVMTREEVDQAIVSLKRFTLSYIDHRAEITRRENLSEQDKAAACELAFRLKENNNWKLRDSGNRTWEDFCRNEFGGALRQQVDRWRDQYAVNRALPEGEAVTKELHARVLAQVPDELKQKVLAAAKEAAPINYHTKQKQLSAKGIAEAAAEEGVVVVGLPSAAQPKKTVAAQWTDKLTKDQQNYLLRAELGQIRERGKQVLTLTLATTEETADYFRRFVETLISNIDCRFESMGLPLAA